MAASHGLRPPLFSGMIRLDPPHDGPTNMALDRDLLSEAEEGRVAGRVYSWSGVWVSLGRFQNASRDLQNPEGTPWVLRPTGGKAVLHGHDATVALAIPLSRLGADPRSIRAIYRAVICPLIEALNACGLPAALAEGTRHANRGPRTADCFAFTSPNDVIDPKLGHKVAGCALHVTDRAVLLQASIPKERPAIDPSQLLVEAAPVVEPPPWRWRDLASTIILP